MEAPVQRYLRFCKVLDIIFFNLKYWTGWKMSIFEEGRRELRETFLQLAGCEPPFAADLKISDVSANKPVHIHSLDGDVYEMTFADLGAVETLREMIKLCPSKKAEFYTNLKTIYLDTLNTWVSFHKGSKFNVDQPTFFDNNFVRSMDDKTMFSVLMAA